jgi:outer membrane protein assembly factor BamA
MRGRALFIVLSLTGCPLPGWAQAPAVDALVGRPITAVRLEAEGGPVTDPNVLAVVMTRVGTALSMADVRESIFHLASIGRFDQVTVHGDAEAAGVALTYRLVAVRRVVRVDFRGTPGVATRRLRQALGTRAFGVPTPERLRASERVLRSLYDSQGFFSAQIATTIVDQPEPARSVLVFAIQSGPRSRIGERRVNATGLAVAEVLAQLRLEAGRPWDAEHVERRTTRFLTSLRREGFLAAQVAWQLSRRDAEGLVDITVEAHRGPLVEIVFDAGDLPEARLRELVPVDREGSVDEDLLEDSKRRIERWLHSRGYARAAVEYERDVQPDRERITFRVQSGPLHQVGAVQVTGVDASRDADVRALVLLRPGEPFQEDAMAASAATIAEFYRQRGFADVRVETSRGESAGRPDAEGARIVEPRFTVVEGRATTIARVVLNGVSPVNDGPVRARLTLEAGAPFYPPRLQADRTAVETLYRNRGYRDVRVEAVQRPTDEPEAIEVTFDVAEGPQYLIGHILVAGNTRTSDATILRELEFLPGTPLGLELLGEGQRRLAALGLFRGVSLEELPHPGRRTSDIAVTVEEAPATSIGYGAGLEGGRRLVRDPSQGDAAVEKIEVSPRGFFEVGRRNLWGKNRSVNLFARLSLRNRGGTETETTEGDAAFYEYRVVGTFREPRLFGTTADMQINAFVEQGVRSSFNFARQAVNAEAARRLGASLAVVGRYTFGKTKLFDQRLVPGEEPVVDRLFPQVRLGILTGVLVNDTRNDPLDPSAGHVASMQGDLAAGPLGSEVGFIKGFWQGFAYRRLPGAQRLVFAGGVRIGLARAAGTEVVEVPDSGNSVEVPIKDLPASERFYAGGSTTVRGYALDRLGDDATIDSDGFPQGGNALVILNGELRFPVWRSIGGVLFLDAGNVFARTGDFDLGRIKATAGGGIRYRSPVGPIRVDGGIKLDRRTFANGQRERGWEVHVSLGQAF